MNKTQIKFIFFIICLIFIGLISAIILPSYKSNWGISICIIVFCFISSAILFLSSFYSNSENIKGDNDDM